MGLTIRCQKTGRSIDMGCGGFWNLRNKVAELAGIGDHYREIEIIERAYFMQDEAKKKAFEEYDQRTDQMISAGVLNEKSPGSCIPQMWKQSCRMVLPKSCWKSLATMMTTSSMDTGAGRTGPCSRILRPSSRIALILNRP